MKINANIDVNFDLNGGCRNAKYGTGVGFDEHVESNLTQSS
jgi:hypothetical protein